MEAAGATVVAFKSFGSYQGSWWAKVTVKDKTGYVYGSFGSCSHCDAFQREFGYNKNCEKHYWEDTTDPDCKACNSYQERLAAFGKSYVNLLWSKEQAISKASEDIDWDSGAKDVVNWLKAN